MKLLKLKREAARYFFGSPVREHRSMFSLVLFLASLVALVITYIVYPHG